MLLIQIQFHRNVESPGCLQCHQTICLEGRQKNGHVESTPFNTSSSVFLVIAELPHGYFLLSVMLCSILCWFSLFYGHHLWLWSSSWPWCFPCCYANGVSLLLRILQATPTKFFEFTKGHRYIQHIAEAELNLLSFWARWWIVCILGDCFGPFSLSPSTCREQRIKGAVFSFLENKRISAFQRCLWFSG